MNILITGSSGFIGEKLLKKLDSSHNVLVIKSKKDSKLKNNNLIFSTCTIFDLNFEEKIINFNPDFFFT